MNRIKLINLCCFLSIFLGLFLLVLGIPFGAFSVSVSGAVLGLLGAIIALVGSELATIRKTLDRLDRR